MQKTVGRYERPKRIKILSNKLLTFVLIFGFIVGTPQTSSANSPAEKKLAEALGRGDIAAAAEAQRQIRQEQTNRFSPPSPPKPQDKVKEAEKKLAEALGVGDIAAAAEAQRQIRQEQANRFSPPSPPKPQDKVKEAEKKLAEALGVGDIAAAAEAQRQIRQEQANRFSPPSPPNSPNLREQQRVLERQIGEALGRGDISAAASAVQQSRDLSATVASVQLDILLAKFKNTPSELTLVEQKQVLTHNLSDALTKNDLISANGLRQQLKYLSVQEKTQMMNIVLEKSKVSPGDLSDQDQILLKEFELTSSISQGNVETITKLSADLKSLKGNSNIISCNTPPNAPTIAVKYSAVSGPTFTVAESETGELSTDLWLFVNVLKKNSTEWDSYVINQTIPLTNFDYVYKNTADTRRLIVRSQASNSCGKSKAVMINNSQDAIIYEPSESASYGVPVKYTQKSKISGISNLYPIRVGEGNTTLLNNLAYEYISDTHKETISLKQNISDISVKSLTPNVCSVDSYYSIFGIRSGNCRLQLATNDHFWLEGANQVVEVQIKGTVSKKKNSKKK